MIARWNVCTLLTVIVTLTTLGCLDQKEADNSDAELGAQATQTEVVDALYAPFVNVRIDQKKVGEFNYYELNQQIQNSQPINAGFVENEILSRTENSTAVQYLLKTTEYKYENGELKPTVSETPITVNKPKSVEANSVELLSISEIQGLAFEAVAAQDVQVMANAKLTFYGLQIQKRQEVRHYPHCSQCELNIFDISFWVVFEYPDKPTYKQQHRIRVSPQVPYFDIAIGDFPYYGGVVDYCIRAVEKIQDKDVFVSFCRVLKDFKFE